VREKILELMGDGDRRLSPADWTALRSALIGRVSDPFSFFTDPDPAL
jgi:hypothetical protein